MSELETFSFEVLGETVDLAYMPRNGFIIREIFQDQCYKPIEFIQGITSLLDIGANIGASTVFFKFTYPNARIHAFEPGAGAYQVLAQNTAPYEMITAHNYGLWFEDTTAALYVGEHDYATASLADPQSGDRKTDTIELKACAQQLRELEITRVDIAKIDTEGCELPILRDLLSNYTMRVIYVEFHSEEDRFAIEDLLRPDYSLFSAAIQHLHRGTLCFVNRQDIADHSDYHRHRITIAGT